MIITAVTPMTIPDIKFSLAVNTRLVSNHHICCKPLFGYCVSACKLVRQYATTNQDQLSGILTVIAEQNVFYKRRHQWGANAIDEI